MADDDKAVDQISVAVVDDTAYVRLMDRGSFKVSKAMKQFGLAAIEKNVNHMVVDMKDCVSMDSTFMGVLAGLAFRLKKQNNGRIHLVNLSTRTRGLIATLGLDQLVQPSMAGEMPLQFAGVLESGLDQIPHEETSRQETAEIMLEAHEDLVKLTPENLPRFKDVLTFLREDINKEEAGGASSRP